jgi:hypothetical protein
VDLRQPPIVERRQQVIARQVEIVGVGAAIEVGLLLLQPEGGELVEGRVAIVRVEGRRPAGARFQPRPPAVWTSPPEGIPLVDSTESTIVISHGNRNSDEETFSAICAALSPA